MLAPERRPSSVLELVGSEEVLAKVLEFVGEVGSEKDLQSLEWALALARLVPGVCLASRIKIGPAGAALLATDASLGGLAMLKGSIWRQTKKAKKESMYVFGALKLNTGLRKLVLKDCRLGSSDIDELVEALRANVGLEELDLQGNRLGRIGGLAMAAFIAGNASLRVLGLRFTKFDAPIGAALATNTGLVELDLGGNQSFDDSRDLAAALATNTTLRKLSLEGNGYIKDHGWVVLIKALLVNCTLLELNVRDTELGHASGVALAEVMRKNSTLQVLDLSLVSFGRRTEDDSASAWPQVLAALKDNVGLHTLRMEQALGADGCLPLAQALEQRPSSVLRELNVSYNCIIGDGACSALVAAITVSCLKPGAALRKLNLKQTGAGREAGLTLAALLRASNTLEVLDLSDNRLGGEDGEDGEDGDAGEGSSWPEVFAALAVNTGLRTLTLRWSWFKGRDVGALRAALQANRSLQELDLSGNIDLGDDGAGAIAAGLATNKSLRRLDLSNTGVGYAAALALTGLVHTKSALRELIFFDNKGITHKEALALQVATTAAS